METTDRIRRTLAEHGKLTVDVATLGEDDGLFAVGLTSHATVNVMLAIEDEFSVEFPDKYLKRSTFSSIAALRAALESLLSGSD